MKLETFFEKFDLFAEAPGAVERIRKLVLQLAVQGKLAPRDHNDEPAGVTFPKLAAAAIEAGQDVFPAHWLRVPLGSTGEWRGGGTPSKSRLDFWEGDLPWVSPKDMKLLHISDAQDHISEAAVEDSSVRIIPPGSLLMVVRGMILARAFPVALTMREVTINQDMKALLASEPNTKEYLLVALRAFEPHVLAAIEHSSHGTCKLKSEFLNDFVIPIPPLAEQRRIVAKVDELMTLCNRLEVQQQEREAHRAKLARASLARFAGEPTPANLTNLFQPSYDITPADLRKSILALAVQGKLVQQDHNDELAEQLITRLAKIRFIKKAKEYGQVPADDIPYEIPSSWSWVRLGNICLASDSGWSPQCLPEARLGTDWGVLKVSAVSWGVYKPEENKALPAGMTSRPDCEVKAGDFLLSRANTEELVARSVVVDQTPPRLMMSDKIVRFTFPNEIERAFVNLANTSEPSRAYYARNASGTSSSMKNIGREVMCNLPIPLPPLAEQRRIIAKFDELMAMIDQLEVQIEKAKKASTALLDAAIDELLNPSTDVVVFPAAQATTVDRAGIGCYVVQKLACHKTFGRVALMKHEYLAEAHIGINLDGHYLRQAAGPLDSWVYRFEDDAAREGWFTVEETKTRDGHKKIIYRKGAELDVKASAAFAALPQAQRDELDRMLTLLGGKPTEEVEIIATLFAVWNDLLIDGHSPNDDEIVTGFREHWHEKKQKFTVKSLHTWLDWMRRNGLVPTGRGPRTQQHSKLDLH